MRYKVTISFGDAPSITITAGPEGADVVDPARPSLAAKWIAWYHRCPVHLPTGDFGRIMRILEGRTVGDLATCEALLAWKNRTGAPAWLDSGFSEAEVKLLGRVLRGEAR